jgi:hypothetical protein
MYQLIFTYLITGAFVASISMIKMYRSKNRRVKAELDEARAQPKFAYLIGVSCVVLFMGLLWPYVLIKEL